MSDFAFESADALDLSDPSKIRIDDPVQANALFREYLTAMFVWVKSGLIFESNNPTLHHACDRIERVVSVIRLLCENSCTINFLADGVFVNQSLLKIRGNRFDQAEYLSLIWSTFGVGSLEIRQATDRDGWIQLITALRGLASGTVELESLCDLDHPQFKLSPPEQGGSDEQEVVSDRVRTLRAYSVAVLAMKDLVQRLHETGRLRLADIRRPLLELITVSATCPDILIALTLLKRHKGEIYNHLVNTAALAIVMAQKLSVPRGVFLEIATGAVLHEIGAAVAPDPPPETSAQVREEIFARESVCNIALANAPFRRITGRVVVANEQRLWVDRSLDSTEYDFDLHPTSRMVAVAQAFDSLTTPSQRRPGLLPDEALRVIRAESGRRYDEMAVRLLVNTLGYYPVGSMVALSNGSTGIVVGTQGGGGKRPRVKLLAEASGAALGGAVLDLDEKRDLEILRCLDAEERGVNLPAFLLS